MLCWAQMGFVLSASQSPPHPNDYGTFYFMCVIKFIYFCCSVRSTFSTNIRQACKYIPSISTPHYALMFFVVLGCNVHYLINDNKPHEVVGPDLPFYSDSVELCHTWLLRDSSNYFSSLTIM